MCFNSALSGKNLHRLFDNTVHSIIELMGYGCYPWTNSVDLDQDLNYLLIVVHGGGPHYCSPGYAQPCLNGATCKPLNSGHDFTCECVEGYKGDTCALIDCSSPIYCRNGGTCHEVNGGLDKTCTCSDGWNGNNCEEIDCSSPIYCRNGGTCHEVNGGLAKTCTCSDGWKGNNCEEIDCSSPVYCRNGGTCHEVNGGLGKTCTCSDGWKGNNCEEIDCSSPIYCRNGGTCHEVNGGLAKTCTCYYGWKGNNCEEIDECTPYQEADFVFLIDASLSVANAGLERQKSYIKNFISKFKDGSLNYRFQFSTVTYSLNATVHFYLNNYTDFTQLQSAVDNVGHENYGPSMTGEALRVVREEVLAPGNGVSLEKDTYVLLITDGLSSDPVETLYQATQLKLSGVRLYTIGTGNQINQKEIVDVASYNSFAYPMATDDALHHVLSHTMFGCQECSEYTSDVALVMDVSSHIDAVALNTQLQAATYLIKNANIGPDDVQFSYQTFSDKVHLVNDFDDFHEEGDLIAEINFRTQIHKGRSRNVTAALEYFINDGFDVSKGARSETRKIVVLFTSGNFTDDVQTAKVTAQRLKDDDFIIVVVGVDLNVDVDVDDLVAISSDSGFTYFIGEDIDVPVSVLGGLLSTITYKRCGHFQ